MELSRAQTYTSLVVQGLKVGFLLGNIIRSHRRASRAPQNSGLRESTSENVWVHLCVFIFKEQKISWMLPTLLNGPHEASLSSHFKKDYKGTVVSVNIPTPLWVYKAFSMGYEVGQRSQESPTTLYSSKYLIFCWKRWTTGQVDSYGFYPTIDPWEQKSSHDFFFNHF